MQEISAAGAAPCAPIIETHGLWKSYGRFGALRGLDLAVPEGSVFALLGENGAGKTTTIKCLLNIIEPSRGTARVLGVDSRALGPAQLAQIGYVSEGQVLPDRLTVGEFFRYVRGYYRSWDGAIEERLRSQFRLPSGRRIGALSHGMRLKLALACALPFGPRLLVLDEPFSGLDPLVREEIIEGFVHRAASLSILISSHEMDELERLATHAAFVHAGTLLLQGPLSALREQALPGGRGAHPQHAWLRDAFIAMAHAARGTQPAWQP